MRTATFHQAARRRHPGVAAPCLAQRRIAGDGLVPCFRRPRRSRGTSPCGGVPPGMQELGWTEGQNIEVEYRWAGGSIERMRPHAAELRRAKPEVILASATVALTALQQATKTIPVVFAQVTDPVGAGFVASLARPGGNITGITQHEFAMGAKWLELVKQLAPHVTRVAVLYDPGNPATAGYLREIEIGRAGFSRAVSAARSPTMRRRSRARSMASPRSRTAA